MAGPEGRSISQLVLCLGDLSASGVGVGRRMEILALSGELLHQAFQFGHPAFRRTDGHTVLAARVTARLARVQPILQGAGQQAIRYVPQVSVLVLIGQAVSEVDGFREGRVEGISDLGHSPLICMSPVYQANMRYIGRR